MFTATLTISDLDFESPEDAAVALLAAAGTARPLSVALHNQHTGSNHRVQVDDETTMLDLLHRNLEAWDGEEDSVKEEHADLISDLRLFLTGEINCPDCTGLGAAPETGLHCERCAGGGTTKPEGC